jgi:uncharacterized delta-60 repeat protein
LAAFRPNGTLDSSFGTNGLATTSAVGEWHDLTAYPVADPGGNAGKLVAVANEGVARYNANGTLDTSWGGTGIVADPAGPYVFNVAIQPDDRVLVSGNNAGQFALVRYNADGSLDGSFGSGGVVTTLIGASSSGSGVAVQPNGNIVQAGSSTTASGNSVFAVARYLGSGGNSPSRLGGNVPSAVSHSFTADPNPVPSGTVTALTASGLTDAKSGAAVTPVASSLVGNNIQALLGHGTNSSCTWPYSLGTAGLAPGSSTPHAQATDSHEVTGDAAATGWRRSPRADRSATDSYTVTGDTAALS